jgi:hypothetical protein
LRDWVILCVVCTEHKEMRSVGFLVQSQNQGQGVSWFGLKTKVIRFPSFGLKTGSCDLMIWPTKSLRRFLDLGLKIKWAMVCQLHNKIDGRMKMAWGTC